MDLSGLYIEGTGTYEVKEISIASGRLIDGIDLVGDGWTQSADANIESSSSFSGINGGYVTKIGGFGTLVSGKKYRMRIKGTHTCDNYFAIYDATVGTILKSITDLVFDETFEIFGTGLTYYAMRIFGTGTMEANIEELTLEEIPPLPLLDKGDTYLECTSSGTVAFPSTQAYGEWEFDLYHGVGEQRIYFISDIESGGYGTAKAYMLYISSANSVTLYRSVSNDQKFASDTAYIENNTWYRFKITRTLDGEFTVYIKGGTFGVDDWTLVSVTGGAGTNPVIDNVHTTSEYFAIDIDSSTTNDAIANIVMRKGVQQ